MKIKLTTTPHKNGRTRVEIEIELLPDEIEAAEKKQCSMHFDSHDPVPCQFYQTPDPNLKVVKGVPDYNGIPYKAFILPAARKVPLNRAIPKKTLLRINVPGKLELGYVAENDMPHFETWWEKTAPALAKTMKEKFFEVVDVKSPIKEEDPTEKVKEQKLNPMDPTEVKGVRRRGLEIY